MLKARGKIGDVDVYFIGLSWGNLARFRAGSGDSFIRIPASESGLNADIMLFSAKTEAELAALLNVPLPSADFTHKPLN